MKQELNYNIDLPSKAEWWRYYGEYKKFIDLVFREVKGGEITTISLPLAFCIRHTLELGYKMNILELEKISNILANINYRGKDAHKIDSLHKNFEKQMRKIINDHSIDKDIVKQFNDLERELHTLKDQIHKLDKYSFAFRYPVKNDGITPNFKNQEDFTKNESINFKEIKDLYEKSVLLLTYTTDVILEELG